MSRPPTRPNFRPARTPLAWALLGLVLLSGATTEDASVLDARRKKIENLSQPNLNQLKRNYETYLKLPPERRAQLARLDDDLGQDAKSGGHLGKLLDQYNAWLFKLSPFDRDKLLNTPDPGERAELVQKLLQDQKQRVARAARAPLLALLSTRLDSAPLLSTKDLDLVFAAVEQSYLKEDSKERFAKSMPPRVRHVEVVRAVIEQLREEREAKTKMRPRETALVETILDAMPNEAVKNQITRSGMPAQTRRQLGQALGRSLLAEWKPELDEAVVTPAQIEELTNKWIAGVTPERLENVQQRLQSPNGKKFAAVVIALQNSPKLKKARQPIMWLLRSFPSPAGNRGNRGTSPSGSAGKSTTKAANHPAEDAEN
jgi:hypothetical protein